ncbi:MAG: tRNA 2-thiouridine(34) synthase MnmA [Candidatus Paceibacterota bacterium]
MKGKETVFVGLSGGVDSSVSAALLKEQGHNVVGVFIKVWQPDFLECTWPEDRLDAMRVCATLEIPFLTFEFGEEYKKEVVDSMIASYKRGETPNPDVLCNQHIKFGSFLKKAKEMGADKIATGHYARVDKEGEVRRLFKGVDGEKDQTYFLWTLTQEELKSTLFPIGGFRKKEVRQLAERFGLPTARKRESQGLCFLGELVMQDFLKHFLEEKEGVVLNEKGEKVGTHEGAFFYTRGQRHGFLISDVDEQKKPHYVIEKDIESNTLTVSTNPPKEEEALIKLRDENWLSASPQEGSPYTCRLRHRQTPLPCICRGNGRVEIDGERAASGQSCVLYNGDECLGGGIITSP